MFRTFKAKLLWGAAASFAATALLAFIAVFGIRSGTQSLEAVYAHQVKSASALTEIDRDLKEIRFRMAAVALDQMPSVGSRNQLTEARTNIEAQWKVFKDLAKQDALPPDVQVSMDEVDKYLHKKFGTFLTKLDAAYLVGNKELVAQALEDDWPVVHKALIKPISVMVPAQWKAVADAYEASKSQGDRLMTFSVSVFTLVALVMMIASYLLVRQINAGMGALKGALTGLAEGNLTVKAVTRHRDEFAEMAGHLDRALGQLRQIVAGVKVASDRAADASSEMSQQAAQIIQRVQTQYDNVMQVSAAMEEISVSISEVATAAHHAAEAVNENSSSATSGNENMQQNIALVERTAHSVSSSAEIIHRLSESSTKIGEIATVINAIAEQTNLLALNAAIEAARAGDQGRGFAVVADEVRKLAEKTRSSTVEIGGVIENIRSEAESAASAMADARSEVESSVSFNQKTGQALDKIVSDATRATEMMEHIVNGTREQSRATDSVAQNMERISSITEENTDSIRGFGKMAEDVSRVAGELRGLVARLQV